MRRFYLEILRFLILPIALTACYRLQQPKLRIHVPIGSRSVHYILTGSAAVLLQIRSNWWVHGMQCDRICSASCEWATQLNPPPGLASSTAH
ncbi:hypothetical protein HDV57DRAFT_393828 [Trichoderma longibrachiatum]